MSERILGSGEWFNQEVVRMTLGTILIALCFALLLFVSMVDTLPNALYFHFAYLLVLAIAAFFLLKGLENAPWLEILPLLLIVALSFRLISIVRVSYPILFGPDLNHELQLVRRILSAGRIPETPVTGSANYYRFFPGLELLISVVSIATQADPIVLLKYFGTFVGLLAVILVACAWRNVTGDRGFSIVAAFLAGLSPMFVAFDTYTVHPMLADIFIAVIFLCLYRRAPTAAFAGLAIVGFIALVVTHSWLPIVLFVILVGVFIAQKVDASVPGSYRSVRAPFLAFMIVAIAAWVAYMATAMVEIYGDYYSSIGALYLSPEISLFHVTPTGAKPGWVVGLTYLGGMSFALSVFVGIVAIIRARDPKHRLLLWLGTASLVTCSSLMSIWMLGFKSVGDLFNRNLTLVYFFAAPLAVLGVTRLKSLRPSGGKPWRGRFLAFGLLFTMLLPSVYYGVDPMFYDRSSRLIEEDVRLGLNKWQSVGVFVAGHVSGEKVYGVRLAYTYVSGYAGKEVVVVVGRTFRGSDILSWASTKSGSILVARISWSEVEDYDYSPSASELRTLVTTSNVVYHASDAVVLVLAASTLP
jgi:hypothetical protein